MSGKQIGKAYLRGCARSLAISVIGGLMGVVLVAFAIYMAHDAKPEDELKIMAMVGGVQLLFTLAIAAAAFWWIRRRGRKLDQGFSGAPGSQVQGNVRGWTGEVRGRRFNAWVARGPRLELYLECDVGTRGAVRRVGPVIQAFGRMLEPETALMESPAALSDCEVLAKDADWMRRFLRRPGVVRVIADLMKPSDRVLSGIRLGPRSIGYIRQFIQLSEITEESVEAWLEELSTLADSIEAVGPSGEGLQPSRLETWSRTSRRLFVNPALLGIGCGLVAVVGIVVIVGVIVAVLER